MSLQNYELYSLWSQDPWQIWSWSDETRSTNLIQARPCFSSQTSSNYILIKSPHDTLCLHHRISISSNLLHFVANQAPGCWALTDALISPVFVSYLEPSILVNLSCLFTFFHFKWVEWDQETDLTYSCVRLSCIYSHVAYDCLWSQYDITIFMSELFRSWCITPEPRIPIPHISEHKYHYHQVKSQKPQNFLG